MTLKNGTDRIRSEPGSQPRLNKNSADRGGVVGSLLSGRNRQNSGPELLNRTGVSSQKDGKVWDHLLSGKSRKNSRGDPPSEDRPPRTTCPSAYISRMIRVDKQDKNGTSSGPVVVPEAEKPVQGKTETVSFFLSLHHFCY